MPDDITVWHHSFEVARHTSVEEALNLSGIYTHYPETKSLSVGIFGKTVSLSQTLLGQERIEIYRPLTLNPMDKRRLRAQKTKGN